MKANELKYNFVSENLHIIVNYAKKIYNTELNLNFNEMFLVSVFNSNQ